MRAFFLLLCVAFGSTLSPCADLGSQVTGALNFTAEGTTNYFDPANSFVPGTGYLNSASCGVPTCTVTISGATPTFGFDDGVNSITADFSSGNELIVTDFNEEFGGTNAFTMTFTDAFFTNASMVSDTFARGGLTFSVSGETIALSYTLGSVNPVSTAVINLGPTLAPEPTTVSATMLGVSLILLVLYRQRHSGRLAR